MKTITALLFCALAFSICFTAPAQTNVVIPKPALDLMTTHSNRIAYLTAEQKKIKAKMSDDMKLLNAQIDAKKITALNAIPIEEQIKKTAHAKMKPLENEIAERRLKILEVQRAYKLPTDK